MNFIDHHKWLVESNLFTDEIKDNIAMGAYCLVEEVIEASTFVDFEKNTVHYRLLLPEDLAHNLDLLNRFENGDDLGFFEMRRLRKFIKAKKENDESGLGYKLENIANSFVRAYLNDNWSAKVEFKSVKDYDGEKDLWLHNQDNSQFN